MAAKTPLQNLVTLLLQYFNSYKPWKIFQHYY